MPCHVLQIPAIDSSSDEGLQPSTLTGNIELKDVVFRYPSRPDVPVSASIDMLLVFTLTSTFCLSKPHFLATFRFFADVGFQFSSQRRLDILRCATADFVQQRPMFLGDLWQMGN